MKLACIPSAAAQRLDELCSTHRHWCFVYNDRGFVCLGGCDAPAEGTQYLVKEVGKDALTILCGSVLVTPAELRIIEDDGG
jgi:hypothetical protein